VWRSALSPTATDGLDLLDSQLTPAAQDTSQRPLALGIEYLIKMRVITGVDESAFYSVKMWPAAESEPDWWNIATSLPAGGTNAGSLALIANRVDATFELIEINNLTPDAYLLAGYINTPPSCDLTVLGSGANLRSGAGPNFAVARSVAGATVLRVNGQRTGQDGFVWYRAEDDSSWIRADLVNIDAACSTNLLTLDALAAGSN
jgi:hypothetical protein